MRDRLGNRLVDVYSYPYVFVLVENQETEVGLLDQWCSANARSDWGRSRLVYWFTRKDDAALFRLRLGDDACAFIKNRYY